MNEKLTELKIFFSPLINIFENNTIYPNIDIEINVDRQSRTDLLMDIIFSESEYQDIQNQNFDTYLNRFKEEVKSFDIEVIKIKKTYKNGSEKIGIRIRKLFNSSDSNLVREYIYLIKPYIYIRKNAMSYTIRFDFNISFEELYDLFSDYIDNSKKEAIERFFIRIKLSLPVGIKGSGLNIRDGRTMVWDIEPPKDIRLNGEFKVPSFMKNPLLEYLAED
ncbi:MAG: hypothetical protein Q4P31_02385 [Andreesenia angusta]|nr:hypothetical protein [Andreesenia angusta]